MWTQSQLDALEEAIASGTMRVAYRDRVVQYQTLEDMLKLRDGMRDEIASGGEQRTARVHSRAGFSRE